MSHGGHGMTVKLLKGLVAGGADPNRKNHQGYTALQGLHGLHYQNEGAYNAS
jgi:hypothetical protein